jgi:hypothetical protein
MPTEHRGPRRSRVDPLVAGVGEGVAAGYRAVEIVATAMAESARRRPSTPFADEPRSRRARRGSGARSGRRGRTAAVGSGGDRESLIGDLADLTADLFEALGEAAQEFAGRFDEEPECPRIELDGVAGDPDGATSEFEIRNTGESALRGVRFVATDLVGARAVLPAETVETRHRDAEEIPRIPVGGCATVTVTIRIPEDAPAGTYRGVLLARAEGRRGTDELALEDAWTLLELYVRRPRHRRVVEYTEEAEEVEFTEEAELE